MDPRHQSIAQETLNELVDLINKYVRDSTDEVLAKQELHNDMRKISKYIYQYADMKVDVDGILSTKNILSIDTVLLPNLDKVLIQDKNSFMQVVDYIQSVLIDLDNSNRSPHFAAEVSKILNKYIRLHRHM